MTARYRNTIGDRITVEYNPDYGDMSCIQVCCRDGWNETRPMIQNKMSIEEARDLHYLLGRVLFVHENH